MTMIARPLPAPAQAPRPTPGSRQAAHAFLAALAPERLDADRLDRMIGADRRLGRLAELDPATTLGGTSQWAKDAKDALAVKFEADADPSTDPCVVAPDLLRLAVRARGPMLVKELAAAAAPNPRELATRDKLRTALDHAGRSYASGSKSLDEFEAEHARLAPELDLLDANLTARQAAAANLPPALASATSMAIGGKLDVVVKAAAAVAALRARGESDPEAARLRTALAEAEAEVTSLRPIGKGQLLDDATAQVKAIESGLDAHIKARAAAAVAASKALLDAALAGNPARWSEAVAVVRATPRAFPEGLYDALIGAGGEALVEAGAAVFADALLA